MAGHGKSMVWQDWQTAYETVWHGLIELDKPINVDHKGRFGDVKTLMVDMMPSEVKSPEDFIIQKDAFEKLSSEAKQIIDIVLDTPADLLDMIKTPKYSKISRKRIYKMLLEKGWKRNTVKACFSEIQEFATNFC